MSTKLVSYIFFSLIDGYECKNLNLNHIEYAIKQRNREATHMPQYFYDFNTKVGCKGIFKTKESKISTGQVEDSDLPAAWIFHYKSGALGMQTMPDYRRKGLAEFLIRKQASENKKVGLKVYSFVAVDNDISQMLHSKIGFIKTYEMECVFFIPHDKGTA